MMRPHRHVSRRSGFTLVEMMVLIGIFGLLAAISLPAFRGYTRANQLDSEADMLVSEMHLVRSTAIMQGRFVQFQATESGFEAVYLDDGQTFRSRTFKGSVALTSGIDITFRPWGSASPTTTMILEDGSCQLMIDVLPTGIVEVRR